MVHARSLARFVACVAVMALSHGAHAFSLSVSATANIYGAGHVAAPVTPDGGGAGILPPGMVLPPGMSRVLRIDATSGLVRYSGTSPWNDADGVIWSAWVAPDWLGLSGYGLNRARILAGVFLDDGEPVDPAPGKIVIEDMSAIHTLVVGLRQIFPIGDGLTGTGSGDVQVFVVPDGATRLYLGFIDSYSGTSPGWYGDNAGAIEADFSIEIDSAAGIAPPRADASARLSLAPNPFNPCTAIRFDLPDAAPVNLAVFDLAGHLVRTLFDGTASRGTHVATWDGRDAAGRAIGSGTYLARLALPDGVEVATMALIR